MTRRVSAPSPRPDGRAGPRWRFIAWRICCTYIDLAARQDRGTPRRMIRLHRISGSDGLKRFAASSRASADAGVIRELFALGRVGQTLIGFSTCSG